MTDYSFAVGSFKFKDFKDLYENIKGRTTGFSKTCNVMSEEKTVASFVINYEKTQTKHQFSFVLEPIALMAFQNNKEMANQLRTYLPKFSKVGSLAPGGAGAQKYYGYLDVSKWGNE